MSATSCRASATSRRSRNSNRETKKVLVALSGGVDSAVSAAFLQKQGLKVVGVFFDFGPWSNVEKVRKISAKLAIPLKIIDARKDFQKKIIDYFINACKKGLTPNPCVVCNREMKFDLLFDLLKKEKADFVATGHYARVRRERKAQSEKRKIEGCYFYKLSEAKDKLKDQSYFLYKLTQRELLKIVFPLGNYKKKEVKKIAKKLKLPIAEEESQDICFLSDKDINIFLKKYIKPNPGNTVDDKKNIIGKHKGLPFYTIGQRKGIGIGGAGPYFVIGKNARKNELIVSSDPKKLLTKKFEVNQVSWVSKEVKLPLSAKVQIRYHAPKISAIIRKVKGGKWGARSEKFLRAVTPGQSAVFFKNGEVLGGGIIV